MPNAFSMRTFHTHWALPLAIGCKNAFNATKRSADFARIGTEEELLPTG